MDNIFYLPLNKSKRVIMNAQVKHLVKQSLKEFNGGTAGQKEIWIHELQEKLKAHERGLKSIGIGYANHLVQAARIFLRIQRDKIPI